MQAPCRILHVKLMLRKGTDRLQKRLAAAGYYLRHRYLSEVYFPKRNGLVKNLAISRFPFTNLVLLTRKPACVISLLIACYLSCPHLHPWRLAV